VRRLLPRRRQCGTTGQCHRDVAVFVLFATEPQSLTIQLLRPCQIPGLADRVSEGDGVGSLQGGKSLGLAERLRLLLQGDCGLGVAQHQRCHAQIAQVHGNPFLPPVPTREGETFFHANHCSLRLAGKEPGTRLVL
jgi:hypothetical protein